MIGLDKALELVKLKNPGMKPIRCLELKDCYSFTMIPEGCVDMMFANSCSYLIDKETGKHRMAHFTEINKEVVKVLPEIEKRTTYF